jgi:pimeloyl-ACP methyl ester carboxylesterase
MSTADSGTPLTVVLVHGAFADSSSWAGVIQRLQAQSVNVRAAPNPLRGISIDSAYVASFIDQIPGPVLAVGHSYGGAVISNAASMARNVVGLGVLTSESKDSVLNSALVPMKYPTGNGTETAVEFAIDPAKAQEAFAADLPADQAAIVGAIQRPVAELAFSEPNGRPAWKTLPSWAVVATGDKAAGTDLVRSMAKRAGARITEVEGSHVIMISKPQVVTEVIMSAIEHTSPAGAGSAARA